MPSGFSGLLILLIIGSLIRSLVKAAEKAGGKTATGRPAAQGKAAGGKANTPAAQPDSYEGPGMSDRLRPLQPAISVTAHDDSIYQGSLYAETGEGYDPCHDEQMQAMPSLNAEPEAALHTAPAVSPFQFSFSGEEVAKAFVMSEILKRK